MYSFWRFRSRLFSFVSSVTNNFLSSIQRLLITFSLSTHLFFLLNSISSFYVCLHRILPIFLTIIAFSTFPSLPSTFASLQPTLPFFFVPFLYHLSIPSLPSPSPSRYTHTYSSLAKYKRSTLRRPRFASLTREYETPL